MTVVRYEWLLTAKRERKSRRSDAIWGKGRARGTGVGGGGASPNRHLMQSDVSVKSRGRQVPNDKNHSLKRFKATYSVKL